MSLHLAGRLPRYVALVAVLATAPAWAQCATKTCDQEGDEIQMLAYSSAVHQHVSAETWPSWRINKCLKKGLGRDTEYLIQPHYEGPKFATIDLMQREGANGSSVPAWVLHNQRVASKMKPTAVVFARTIDDVKVATRCAYKEGLAVAGQCGRSSYTAYCTSNCILVNVNALNHHSIDANAEMAVLGAGMNLGQVYHRLDAAGFTVPAGTIPSVGLAGLTLGGGKGPFIRQAGMMIDQLRGIDAVLGDGTIVHADENENPDLLWLARGGGGGTFPGIITAFHFHLVRRPEVVTEFYAQWDFVQKPGSTGEQFDVQPAIEAWKVWQKEYLMHPDPRVWVRLEVHPYKEGGAGSMPYIAMSFKFLGIGLQEAEPLVDPIIRALGQPRFGKWHTYSHIESLIRGSGIGDNPANGCKTWNDGLTMDEAKEQLLRSNEPFCTWDAGFDTAYKHRGLHMTTLSDEALETLMNLVIQAPMFDPTGKSSWFFYLQVDPTNGYASTVDPTATAYPWRHQDSMTLQVIAKWGPDVTSYTLEGFNKLIVSSLQPYVGAHAYYNYADDDMPGGVIPLFAFYGENAARVLEVRAKYAHIPLDEGSKWILRATRPGVNYGMQLYGPSHSEGTDLNQLNLGLL